MSDSTAAQPTFIAPQVSPGGELLTFNLTVTGDYESSVDTVEVFVEDVAVVQYTLTVNITGQGSVSLNPAGGTYDEGTNVTLTAIPSSGLEFSCWTGDATGSTNPLTINMDGNKTVTAVFTEIGNIAEIETDSGSIIVEVDSGSLISFIRC